MIKKASVTLASSCLVASLGYSQSIVNGSFEAGPATSGNPSVQLTTPSSDVVPGWRAFDVDNPDKVSFYHVYDPAEATDGDYYIRIVSTYEEDDEDTAIDTTYHDDGAIAIKAGVEHTLSFDLRTTDDPLVYSDIFFNIRTYNNVASGDPDYYAVNDQFDSGALTITGSWATYSYSFTPTTDVNGNDPLLYFRVSSRLGGVIQEQTIHLDNVSLIPEPSAAAGILGLGALLLVALRRR